MTLAGFCGGGQVGQPGGADAGVPTREETQGDQHDEDDERQHQHLAQAALPPGLPQRLPVHLQGRTPFQRQQCF